MLVHSYLTAVCHRRQNRLIRFDLSPTFLSTLSLLAFSPSNFAQPPSIDGERKKESNWLLCLFLLPTDKGNPGDLPGLYSGSVAEFTKADTVIFRTDLFNTSTGEKVHPFKRTIKYDSKWLDSKSYSFLPEQDHSLHVNTNDSLFFLFFHSIQCVEPNFVGSFDIGDYVYFFFRESAVEYINCGKNVFSRIARVCKVCLIIWCRCLPPL